MNYFDLFGFPERARIDNTRVQKKYIELQKKFHPDYFTQESETDRELAQEQSAHINKAFNIFRNRDKTLEYFLEQKGVISADEKYSLPPDFLMEMMELNEAVAEEKRETIIQLTGEFENSLEQDVKDIITKTGDEIYSPSELERLKEYFYKKKYLQRILDRLGD